MVYMFPKDPCPEPPPKTEHPPVHKPRPEPEPHPKKPECEQHDPVPTQAYCPPPNLDPCAEDDCIEACSGEKTTLSVSPLLQNDFDKDSDQILVAGMQPYSDHGAKIDLIDSDGDGVYDTYCYDPTCSAELSNLCDGESITDCFTYLVSDGKGGYDTAVVYVKVNGGGKGDNPVDDDNPIAGLPGMPDLSADYASDVEPSAFLPDGLSFIGIDYTSSLGASIWREDYDGNGTIDRIVYDPTQSTHLAMLKPGESAVDTVNYTLQDSDGNTFSTSVEITVYGGDVPGTGGSGTNSSGSSNEFVNDVSSETQYLEGDSTSSQFVISGNASDYSWGTIDDAGDRLVVVWDNASQTPDLLYDYASLKFDDVSIDLFEQVAG